MATSKKYSCAYTLPTGGSARAFFTVHADTARTPAPALGAVGDIYVSTTNPPSVFVRYATQWRGPLPEASRSGISHPKYPELGLYRGNAGKTTWVSKQVVGAKRKAHDEEVRPTKKVKREQDATSALLLDNVSGIMRVRSPSPRIKADPARSPTLPAAPVKAELVSPADPAQKTSVPNTASSAPTAPPLSVAQLRMPIPDESNMTVVSANIPAPTDPDVSVIQSDKYGTSTPTIPGHLPLCDAQIPIPTSEEPIPATLGGSVAHLIPDSTHTSPPPAPDSDAHRRISTLKERSPAPMRLLSGSSVTHVDVHATHTATPVELAPPPLPDPQPPMLTPPEETIPAPTQPPTDTSMADTNIDTTETTAPVTLGWIRCSTGTHNPPSPSHTANVDVQVPSAPPPLLNIPNVTAGLSVSSRPRPQRDFVSAPVVVRNFWGSSAAVRESLSGPALTVAAPAPAPASAGSAYYWSRPEERAPLRPPSSFTGVAPTSPAPPPSLMSWTSPSTLSPYYRPGTQGPLTTVPGSTSTLTPTQTQTPAPIQPPRSNSSSSAAAVALPASTAGPTRTPLPANRLEFTEMRSFGSDVRTRMGVEPVSASSSNNPWRTAPTSIPPQRPSIGIIEMATVDQGKKKQTEVIDLTDSPDVASAPLLAAEQAQLHTTPAAGSSGSSRQPNPNLIPLAPERLIHPKSLADIPIVRSSNESGNTASAISTISTLESNNTYLGLAGLRLLQERNTLGHHRDQLLVENEQLGQQYQALFAKYKLLNALVTSAPISTLLEQNTQLKARVTAFDTENGALRKENQELRAKNSNMVMAGLEGLSGASERVRMERTALEREVLNERSAKDALKLTLRELQMKNAALEAIKGELEKRLAARGGLPTNTNNASPQVGSDVPRSASIANPASRNSDSSQSQQVVTQSAFVGAAPTPPLIQHLTGDADKFTLAGVTFTISSLIAIVEQKGGGRKLVENAWGQILAQLQVMAPKETPLQVRGWKDTIVALREFYLRDLVHRESPEGSFIPGKIVEPGWVRQPGVSVLQVSQPATNVADSIRGASAPVQRSPDANIAQVATTSVAAGPRFEKHTSAPPAPCQTNNETAQAAPLGHLIASTSSQGNKPSKTRTLPAPPQPNPNAIIATENTDNADREEVEVVQAELLLDTATVQSDDERSECRIKSDTPLPQSRLQQSHLDILWMKEKTTFSCMACKTVNITYSLPQETDPAELGAHLEKEHRDLCDVLIGQTVGMSDEEVRAWFSELDG